MRGNQNELSLLGGGGRVLIGVPRQDAVLRDR